MCAERTEYAGDSGQHPYMLMLVPTKSVRWGGQALDNSTEDGSTSTSDDGERDEEDSTSNNWLEIGCQVRHARIVSDVKFTAV
jgi:hypothetical protein